MKDAFEARGQSDDAAAASLGISAPFLRALYNGETDITQELAVKIGEVMGTGEGIWIRVQATRNEWLLDPRSKLAVVED